MSYETGTPSRELRVPAEVARLNKLTEVLGQSISSLCDRLNPVLSAPQVEPPQTAKDMIERGPGTPLVGQLSEVAGALERSAQRINELLARLEV